MAEPPEPQDDPRLAIAVAIADRSPVPWSELEPEVRASGGLVPLRVLETIGRVLDGAQAPPLVPSSPDARPPALFHWGELEVLDHLGSGSFGEVYAAWDPKLERIVALKLRRADRGGHGASDRAFLAEARRLARVRHPNVMTVHGADVHDGRLGFWSERIEGESLEDLLQRQGPFAVAEAIAVGRDLCRALQAVHENGLVHGDVKTSNVMRERGGRIVLMDFGASTEAAAAAGGGERLVRGTPVALAPEVLRGEAPGPRADLYALGALLHRLLTGRYPVERQTVAELVEAHAAGAAAPLLELRRKAPARLVAVIETALAPEPSARYESAAAMERALAKLAAPRLGWRRVLAATLLAVAAAGAGWVLHRSTGLDAGRRPNPKLAVVPLTAQAGDPAASELTESLAEGVIAELSRLGAIDVLALGSVQRAGETTDTDALANRLGASRVVTVESRAGAGGVRVTLRLPKADGAATAWERSYDVAPGELPGLQRRLAGEIAEALTLETTASERQRLVERESVDPEAHRLTLRARHLWRRRDAESLESAAALYRRAIDVDPAYAAAWVGLADVYLVQGGYRMLYPEEAFPQARAAAQRALEADEQNAEAHATLGAVLQAWDRRWAEAERHLRRALDLRPGYGTAHQRYAELLTMLGRHDEAISHARRAFDLDPLSPAPAVAVGTALYKAGRTEEAIAALTRAWDRHPGYGTAIWYLGAAEIEAGRPASALQRFERATPVSNEMQELHGLAAYAHARAGRPAAARAVLARFSAYERDEAAFVVAMVHVALGEHAEALAAIESLERRRDSRLPMVATEPAFAPLRDEPRLRAILRRIGLEGSRGAG